MPIFCLGAANRAWHSQAQSKQNILSWFLPHLSSGSCPWVLPPCRAHRGITSSVPAVTRSEWLIWASVWARHQGRAQSWLQGSLPPKLSPPASATSQEWPQPTSVTPQSPLVPHRHSQDSPSHFHIIVVPTFGRFHPPQLLLNKEQGPACSYKPAQPGIEEAVPPHLCPLINALNWGFHQMNSLSPKDEWPWTCPPQVPSKLIISLLRCGQRCWWALRKSSKNTTDLENFAERFWFKKLNNLIQIMKSHQKIQLMLLSMSLSPKKCI